MLKGGLLPYNLFLLHTYQHSAHTVHISYPDNMSPGFRKLQDFYLQEAVIYCTTYKYAVLVNFHNKISFGIVFMEGSTLFRLETAIFASILTPRSASLNVFI